VQKFDYTNRYNDIISFVKEKDWEIRMIGGEYYRFGWNTKEQSDNKEYNMADPSGGPYIASGSDMGRFMKEWTGLIVKHLTPDSVSNEVIIHLHQGRMMKGVTNDKDELRWYKAGDSSGQFERYNDMEQFLVAQNDR
jgi:hypothetical protein